MKTLKYITLSLIFICSFVLFGCMHNADSVPSSSSATTVSDYTMSEVEAAVFDEMNLARTDPKGYVNTRLKTIDLSKASDSYKEAVEELIEEMSRMNALPDLAKADGLGKCAREWVNISGPEGYVGHEADISVRFKKYCSYNAVGENCSYGYATGIEIVKSLLIDDGVDTRGHRKNILSRAFSHAGVAVGTHKKYKTMCCIDFASNYKVK